MKCPFCDVEMLRGYLYCDVAIWSTQKDKSFLSPNKLPNSKEKYALRLKLPMKSQNCVESDCCPKCKRIIIDSSGYESNME
jgi:Zn-finger nucleic acid-binding protein